MERWCAAEGVLCRVRHITECSRGKWGPLTSCGASTQQHWCRTPRDVYEKQSRDIRFAFYRTVLAEFPRAPGVIFGHHMGDVRENVVSNAMKGAGVLDVRRNTPLACSPHAVRRVAVVGHE